MSKRKHRIHHNTTFAFCGEIREHVGSFQNERVEETKEGEKIWALNL